MRNDGVIVGSGDLHTIGDNMAYLSDCIDQVSSNVNSINGQVEQFQEQINDMKSNVSALEQEVRKFMQEMKQSALVNDAKQSIMLSQMEYDKKYGHRADVRRRMIGLLQSIDINAVKMNTMENIGEETVVNNPDYWLAPALVSLCYWYSDNKMMAQTALKKAMERSDEKTSLLFCLIHLRANRIKTAIKWLNRYLSLQDPTNMDCKIILLLDALSNGVFDSEITNMLLNKIDSWKVKLNAYPEYVNKQVTRWENYFKSKEAAEYNIDNYVNEYVLEKDIVNDTIHFSTFHMTMMDEFKKKMNTDNLENTNYLAKIDRLLNMLIFDYEDEELMLKSDIERQNNIVNGNIEVNQMTNDYLLSYSRNDFYTHITNICLNDNINDYGVYTKKMAIAFSNEYIVSAYNNISSVDDVELSDLNILIEDWVGSTKNGQNELELKNDFEMHLDKQNSDKISQHSLLTKEMVISFGILVAGVILFHKYIILVLLLIVGILIYNGIMLFNRYKEKQNIINELEEEKRTKLNLLMCVIAEIVDYYFVYIDSNKKQNEFINYINSLNYMDYIRVSLNDKKRNIIIGGE